MMIIKKKKKRKYSRGTSTSLFVDSLDGVGRRSSSKLKKCRVEKDRLLRRKNLEKSGVRKEAMEMEEEDSRGFHFDGNSNASLSNLLLPDKISNIQDFLDVSIDLNSVFDLNPPQSAPPSSSAEPSAPDKSPTLIATTDVGTDG